MKYDNTSLKNKFPDDFRAKDELRSEKVRNIIGQVPPVLLSYGISIIGIAHHVRKPYHYSGKNKFEKISVLKWIMNYRTMSS